ncbi:MAG: RluA family pseudouridine synthase [Oscillospiraceae bacterium]|jgi:23S rRNA pseudouridine1911/1915/1917 synthase|nr:RluA family pseudouridine synthase [Oscillospiraceae bacterium]
MTAPAFVEVNVEAGSSGRLDKVLAAASARSRSFVESQIRAGRVFVEGEKMTKTGFMLKPGQRARLLLPPPAPIALEPEPMQLSIIYEDNDMAVVDKPAGLVTHPAAGHASGTLVNGLLARLEGLSGIGGALRPGIVHRLDKDTSGLILVAKSDRAHARLAEDIASRRVRKTYLAVVHGAFREDEGRIDAPVGRHPTDRKRMAVTDGGRNALTLFKQRVTLGRQDGAGVSSLLEVEIITGRTHQIRVHMAWRGHPVLGDPVYGLACDRKGDSRLMLHAWRLGLAHPVTGEPLSLESPVPAEFFQYMEATRSHTN